jgi:3',5'-cyclic AMP phosphodiesterase CpdA
MAGPPKVTRRRLQIGICSDIHVHRHDQASEIQALIAHLNAQRDLDLLICAGDLSHRPTEAQSFLRAVTLDCPRAWVPGNHDLWVIDPESEKDTAEFRFRFGFPVLSKAESWHYLPEGPLSFAGGKLAVVGTTGWFTDRGYSEWFDAEADDRDDELAKRLAAELDRHIASVPNDARLIVVTHHVPHPACLLDGDPRKAEHSVRIAEVIARYAKRIDLVVHGHKHRRYGPTIIEGVPYVAHPFGYPRQHERPEDGLRVIELDRHKLATSPRRHQPGAQAI